MKSGFKRFSNLIVLPHSVFALPFALAAFFLAIHSTGFERLSGTTLGLVILSVVFARTAAMAFNRLVDADIDATNPRTSSREIPQGLLSKQYVRQVVVLSSLAFVLCAAFLGQHCLVLAPLVLLVLFGYSYAKRFTSWSHFILGLALALAPGGAWWVVSPTIHAIPLLLMGTVLCWVAGFDILYSVQDEQFDRQHALHSIPARYGIARALTFSTLLHFIAVVGFVLVGVAAHLPLAYYIGTVVLSVFLIGQHYLVSPSNLTLINRAFFTCNGMTSILYLLLVIFSLGQG